jgi:UDP-N-acetyl-D-glucosamine dehydrogenase
MNIDIWEVIAAATKPFGFTAFQPGLDSADTAPIDPFYLSWKAKEYDFSHASFSLPGNKLSYAYVVERVATALNDRSKSIRGHAS